MTRPLTSLSFYLSFLVTTTILSFTDGQIGTITQDVYAVSAFSLQKPCAQSCFVNTGFCPNDVLGSQIGCKSWTDCYEQGWQATNDCYCRSDLQKPAQDYLTSCVAKKCTVGDVKIDGAQAGSIYAQYCKDKGFSAVAEPATISATATKSGNAATTAAGGAVGAGPTATSTSEPQGSSSGTGKLPTTTIVGIAVGGLAGLVFFLVALKIILKWLGCTGGRKSHYEQQPIAMHSQAVYPTNLYPQEDYQQKAESEVTPDDSVSMVSGMPRPAPTLVSNAHATGPYSPRRY